MRRRQTISARLRVAAAESDGLVDVETLRRHGITTAGQHRLAREGLVRLSSGLYVIDRPDDEWRARLRAAIRIGGPGAAAFGVTALALHGLTAQALPVHVLVADGRNPRPRSWARFVRRARVHRRILTQLDLPRVALEDSVLDAGNGFDELEFIAILTRAFQERRTTIERMADTAGGRRRLRHRRLLGLMLTDTAGVESVLEHLYVTDVERAHGLEAMTRQFVVPETGHRADGAYLEKRQLIELDGLEFHDRDADQALDTRHAAARWSTMRFGWADCHVSPCRTARIVGGGVVPKPCRRCRAH